MSRGEARQAFGGCVVSPWKIGVNGTGKRNWFVWRHTPDRMVVACDARGRYRLFGSQRAAERVRDALQRLEVTQPIH